MPNRKHLQHIKSSQLNKVPTAEDLLYGEIAVNYAKDGETLYIKNTDGEIVSFPNSKVIEENEFVIASHLAELDEKISQGNTDFEEKERVIAEALVEHNDRLDALDTVIEDNEQVTAQALSLLRQDLDELDEITAAALYQSNRDIEKLKDLNIETQFEVTAQALADLGDRVNTVSTKDNQILAIYNNTETVKPNVYTLIKSALTDVSINLQPESFDAEKTYTIEFDSELLPRIETITWPDNIYWEGNNVPDASDFTDLDYNYWLVTINNGYLGSYKRYWKEEEEETYGIKIINSNGRKDTIQCSEIEDGVLTSELCSAIKPMLSDSFLTIGNCITSIEGRVLDTTNIKPDCIIFDNCNFDNIVSKAFYLETNNNTVNVTGDISIGCNDVTANVGTNAFNYCKGFKSITLGKDFVGPNSTSHSNSPFLSIEVKTVNYDVPTSSTQYLFESVNIDVVNIGPNVVSIPSYCFQYCYMTELNISEGITTFNSYSFKGNSFKKLVIPNSVERINYAAFSQCTINDLVLGSGITAFEDYAFGNSTTLKTITCYATTPPTGLAGALKGASSTVTNNLQIYVPAASVNTYKSASGWSTYASRIQAIPTE